MMMSILLSEEKGCFASAGGGGGSCFRFLLYETSEEFSSEFKAGNPSAGSGMSSHHQESLWPASPPEKDK